MTLKSEDRLMCSCAIHFVKFILHFYTCQYTFSHNYCYTRGMIKEFFMKQMLKSKLKHLPKEQQDKIIAVIEKNPDFFENIAKKIDARVKQGKDQMAATMEVMREHQAELQKLMTQ